MSKWQEIQIRYIFNVYTGSTPKSDEGSFWDGDINWITPEDVSKIGIGELLVDTRRTITIEGYESCGATLVTANSIVLTKRAPIGQLAIIGITACSNQGCFLLRPKKNLEPRFFYYYLLSQKEFLNALGRGSTFMELSSDDLKSLKVPIPKLSIQKKISIYLDTEIQKIEILISTKENLLLLLAEKRQALIQQAVTRGLDPEIPLKDSGVEWLGEVPAYWEVIRLKWLYRKIEQGWSPRAENSPPEEGQWAVVKLSAIKNGEFDYTKIKALPEELDIPKHLEIKVGDFLVTRANTPSLVGEVCIVKETRQQIILSDLVYRLSLKNRRINGAFLNYYLLSIGRRQIEADARGTSNSMVKISQEHISNWLIVVPPMEEQATIVHFLDDKVAKLDSLSQSTENTIVLLKERRTALISAAVTGQIQIPAS